MGQLFHQFVPAHVQPGHESSAGSVVTGVDDTAVCLGSAAAHVFITLKYTDIQFISGKFPCNSGAGYAGPDDDHVIHTAVVPFLFGFFCETGMSVQSSFAQP